MTVDELAADIRRSLTGQGWDPGERSAREMAERILADARARPDRVCTATCGCMTLEELLAKYPDLEE